MPVLVEAVKNDSFLGTVTAGSGKPDFLWSQPLPQVKPVLLVLQSCLKVSGWAVIAVQFHDAF